MNKIEITCSDFMTELILEVIGDNMSPDNIQNVSVTSINNPDYPPKAPDLLPSEGQNPSKYMLRVAESMCKSCINHWNVDGLEQCVLNEVPKCKDNKVYCYNYRERKSNT